jgi:glutaredoxin
MLANLPSRFAAALLLVLLSLGLPLSAATTDTATPGATVLEVFVRQGCPHCDAAKRFVAQLQREQPALQVTVRDVQRDPLALERLRSLVAQSPGRTSGVPAFFVQGELVIGFADEKSTGARIRALLERKPAPAGKAGEDAGICKMEEETACAIPSAEEAYAIELPWIGKRISLEDVGLPVFTIAIGLLDGFNPCSMWVLIMMISMLAAVGDRRRMLAIAGTFVLIEGIAYFAFMAAWLNLFMVIGISRTSEVVLGAIALLAGLINVKDFFAFGRGISLSIPAAAKPGIVARMRRLMHEQSLWLAVAGTVVLAILVQIVELLCTSGLPALYTRILTLRKLDSWSYYGYLLLYIVMYMLDDVIVLAIGVVTLSQKRLQEKEGRHLKLLSGTLMLLLGFYLLAFPH